MKGLLVLLGIAIGLVIAWLLPGPLTIALALAGIAGGVVLGFILAATLVAKSRGEVPVEVAKEALRQVVPDPAAEERRVHEQLTLMNRDLRLDPLLAPEVLKGFEALIDAIRETIGEALEKVPGAEATHDLKKLGGEHLRTYANEYLALGPEDRKAKQSGVLERLAKIASAVRNAKAALDSGRLDSFEGHQAFMDMKW